MIFWEEVKTLQEHGYHGYRTNLVKFQEVLWKLMQDDPDNQEEITKYKQTIQFYKNEIKYIDQQVSSCAYNLRLHKDKIQANITALTDILKPVA